MAYLEAVNGKRVYYEHFEGDNTPVVLVHCWGGTSRLWNTVIGALLNAGHEVLTLDHRACGKSDKDFTDVSINAIASDVVRLIEKHELVKPVINGWSLGGAVAMEAASRLGDNLGGVVLTGAATPRFTPTHDWPYGNDRQGIDESLALRAKDRPAAMRGIADASIATPISEELSRWVTGQFNQNGPRADATLKELLDIDQRELARQLDRPVLVIAGDQDTFVPFDGVEASMELFKDARLFAMPGYGHAPHLEDPATYNTELLSFLQEVSEHASVSA